MKKKSFLFSLFVITALALVVFTFRMKTEFKEEQRTEMFKERVENINLFLDDMERDIERSLYVASFRAFLGADEYMHREDEFLSDVASQIPILILNGSINGQEMNSTNSSTFNDWIRRMGELSKRFNINITFKNISIEIGQVSPWLVNVTFECYVGVSDIEGIAEWNFSIIETAFIDISEAHFADPTYFKGSIDNNPDKKPLFNSIYRTPYNSFWENDSDYDGYADVTKLMNHTMGQFYINNTHAPSFLMRLEGNMDGSPYGIESLVNVINATDEIWDYSEEESPTCAVDYQFFYKGCKDMHNIINMNQKFMLNWSSLIDYNLTKINST